ncbi:unnamed protein product, partial [Amoebophrya sp. A25]|eukprot:GSA25T00009152001.1
MLKKKTLGKMWRMRECLAIPRQSAASLITQKFALFSSVAARAPSTRVRKRVMRGDREACQKSLASGLPPASWIDADSMSRSGSRQNNNSRDATVFVRSALSRFDDMFEIFALPRCSRGSFLIRYRRRC